MRRIRINAPSPGRLIQSVSSRTPLDCENTEVRHPDFIATSTNGRVVTVFDDAGQHIIDVRLVVEITYP